MKKKKAGFEDGLETDLEVCPALLLAVELGHGYSLQVTISGLRSGLRVLDCVPVPGPGSPQPAVKLCTALVPPLDQLGQSVGKARR